MNPTPHPGRLASGDWLDRSLIAFAAWVMLAGTAGSLAVLLLTAQGTVDLLNRPLGTDFSSFWTAGRMTLEGHAPLAYDWVAHHAMQVRTHGLDDYFPWSYPPSFLLVAAAVAALPYVPALIVWQGAFVLAAGAAFRQILPSRFALLVAGGFPAVLICLGHGQTGFLTAALMAGGVLLLPRRQVLAGILFGLLTYKPQFGVLIPVILIAGGYWRAIATATATVATTAAITLALWGWPVWQAFFDSLPLTRTIVFEAGNTGFEKFQSIFAWARLWGGSLTLAYGLQAVVAGISTLACWRLWRSDSDHRLKGAALMIGALLASPYTLDYDFILLGMALALLVRHAQEHGFLAWEKTLIAAAWFAPLVARSLAQTLLLPVGFLALATVFAWTLHRARIERATQCDPAADTVAAFGTSRNQGTLPGSNTLRAARCHSGGA